MRIVIEARILEGDESGVATVLGIVEHSSTELCALGLSLAEGRTLLRHVQEVVVQAQCRELAEHQSRCAHCGQALSRKGMHRLRFRTAFGKIETESPRFRYCSCQSRKAGVSYSPVAQALPLRMTPELEYLQAKWAAHLPFAAAVSLLKEILPLEEAISISGLKNRVRAVGQELDDRIEQAIKNQVGAARCPSRVTALAVDSAWLKHCEPPRYQDRHVNIVAGRATHEDGGSRVYAYVTKEVSAPAARLDHFLCENGVGLNEPVTVISDGAAEFEKAVNGSKRPLNRILDWFHIAMKFRAIEQSALKHRDLSAPSGRPIERDIAGAKWLLWHGRASKAIARLKQLHDMFGLVPEPPYQTLWWNLRGTYFYLEANKRYLVNYGARYRSGLPISSGIAESAVNQVVSARFAKKRQMRWSDEGAHLLAQIRVQLLNGELRPRAAPIPLRYPKPEADPQLDALLLRAA